LELKALQQIVSASQAKLTSLFYFTAKEDKFRESLLAFLEFAKSLDPPLTSGELYQGLNEGGLEHKTAFSKLKQWLQLKRSYLKIACGKDKDI